MDLANERVASLIMKDFRKFVKIFSYLKVRTDIQAMDDQVALHKETNPAKVFESQVVICTKMLQLLVNFPKYTNV